MLCTASSYRLVSPGGTESVKLCGAGLALRSRRKTVRFAVVVDGLYTHTVVYHTEGATPGCAATEGRNTSVPVKPAQALPTATTTSRTDATRSARRMTISLLGAVIAHCRIMGTMIQPVPKQGHG